MRGKQNTPYIYHSCCCPSVKYHHQTRDTTKLQPISTDHLLDRQIEIEIHATEFRGQREYPVDLNSSVSSTYLLGRGSSPSPTSVTRCCHPGIAISLKHIIPSLKTIAAKLLKLELAVNCSRVGQHLISVESRVATSGPKM